MDSAEPNGQTQRHSRPAHSRSFAKLAGESVAYAGGAAVGKLIGLLLLPVLTRSLDPDEFGRFDLLSTSQSALASVILLGFDLAAARLYVDLDDGDRRRLFATWLAFVLTVSGILVVATTLTASPISEAWFGTTRYATAVRLTALAILGSTTQLVTLNALRNRRRAPSFAIVTTATLVVNAVLVVVLVPGHRTATAAMTAMSASMVAGGVLGVFVARTTLRGAPSRAVLRRLAKSGLPAAPAVVLTWLAELVNRSILLRSAGPAQVGYFSVATRFASVAILVVMGFQLAWQPAAFELGTSPAALRRIAEDGHRIVVGVAMTTVLVAATSPELVRLASGDAYEPALRATGFSLLFAVAFALFHVATMPSAISSKLRDIGGTSVVAVLVGVMANLVLAPVWGAWGTAASLAIGQLAGVTAAVGLARRRLLVPYDWLRTGAVVISSSTAVLTMTWSDGGATLVARVAAISVFIATLILAGSLRGLWSAIRTGIRSR